jgi:hypothetical protein
MSIDYTNIRKYLSPSRLQKYEAVCSASQKRSLKLYQTNLRLSQAFYPILSIWEIVLRNAINEQLITHYNDPDWLRNQVSGFMSDPSLIYFDKYQKKYVPNKYLKNCLRDARIKVGHNANHNKIVAELRLGFWVALFDKATFKVLKGIPLQIFPNLSAGTNRSNVFAKICRIRDFRNRIYHNEPVVFQKDNFGNPVFSISACKSTYNDIKDLFQWLNLDFQLWTKRINNIPFELRRAECMVKYYPNPKYYILRIKLGIEHYMNKYLLYKSL